MNLECALPSDGPIGLVALDSYRGFVSEDWTWDSLVAHLVSEMNAGHACVWGYGGDNGNIVVRATDQPFAEPGHREFVTTLEVGPAGAYFVNYDVLTTAAQFENSLVAHPKEDLTRHVPLAPGRYRCRVVQWIEPALAMGNWQFSTAHVHFVVELLSEKDGQLRAVSELPWTETGEIPKDEAVDALGDARRLAKGKSAAQQKARRLFLDVLKRFPDRADLWAELGELELDELDEPARAAQSFAKARAALGPRASADLLMLEAKALGQGNVPDLDSAERLAREAIARGGQSGPRLYVLGDIVDSRNAYSEAAKLFERALQYTPNDEMLRWGYTEELYRKLRDGEAAERFLASMGVKKVDVGFLEIRAVNLVWNLHRFQEAIDVYQAAMDREPGPQLTARMACCKLCLGELEEARRLFEEALPELEADDDFAPWLIESLFQLFVLSPADRQADYLVGMAEQMAVAGRRAFADWVFDLIAEQAVQRGHPEAAWLPALAKVLERSAPIASLAAWPAWQAAMAAAEGRAEEGEPSREEFAQNFRGLAVPVELAKLLTFQYRAGFECYCEGFGLTASDQSELDNWSKDDAFRAALMPFAQATGSGSTYALWACDGNQVPSAMPVVVFGDEGGVHVVAEHLRDLLRILTCDVEPMIDFDKISFYKPDDHESREAADEYAQWLNAQFGLDPVDDPDPLVTAAQEKYQAKLDAWLKDYLE